MTGLTHESTKLYTHQEVLWATLLNFEPAHFVELVNDDTTYCISSIRRRPRIVAALK